ncbi:nitronate monooxygenase [Agromyces sp. NPDC049794]|uniref:NAD(P)H-dependent flavin oxidoreductase n=1 Tax=unclassified Agromyces TaxID=2639701 RepID=UPI0033ED7A7E
MSESPTIPTRFSAAYGVRHPFAGAGLAFAAETPDLAIAVSAAGGIGALGVGFVPADPLRASIHVIRDAVGDRPFNINFITVFDNDAQIRVCAEERVPVVSFHWGHPSAEHRRMLQDAGVSVWEQVGTIDDAKRAVDDGVDVVVAQGWEAGGHNYGGLPTFVLVPRMRDALGDEQLILAAGGIVDGRGVAGALALGADGVWVGTRLVATVEANVHPEHHRRLLGAEGTDTVRSSIFGPEMPDFNPMRLQRNRVVAEYTDRLAEVPTERSGEPEIGRTVFLGSEHVKRKFDVLLPTPETTGDFEEMPFLMGQGVGSIHEIEPAGVVVERMMREAHDIIAGLGAR